MSENLEFLKIKDWKKGKNKYADEDVNEVIKTIAEKPKPSFLTKVFGIRQKSKKLILIFSYDEQNSRGFVRCRLTRLHLFDISQKEADRRALALLFSDH